jgi:hypothetical protein
MIERSLLPERPVGFIDAPAAESGKTTLTKMMIAAVTGGDAVASAWSPNEEERRKALLAIFDAGLIYALWDNIIDGTAISCPHVERSCTANYYGDRRLGVSEHVTASAATVHLFTGINICARGALASRELHVRVDTALLDPMARTFKHNDIVGWTKANREKILGALYTILLGNPSLDLPADAPTRTRFPLWYRIVGSAVEHAARVYAAAEKVDFGKLFADRKTADEERASLGEMLDELDREMRAYFAPPSAAARSVFGNLANAAPPPVSGGEGEWVAKEIAAALNNDYGSGGIAIVRGFLFQKIPLGAKLSPHTVTRALKAYIDRPTTFGDELVVLRARDDPHNKVKIYRVERKKVSSPVDARETGKNEE